jgi:hypothetical protein
MANLLPLLSFHYVLSHGQMDACVSLPVGPGLLSTSPADAISSMAMHANACGFTLLELSNFIGSLFQVSQTDNTGQGIEKFGGVGQEKKVCSGGGGFMCQE